MNIIILGPQGSGKGTQAELLADKYNLLHLETGKLLREIADSDHPLAEKIRNVMNKGELVSNTVLEQVISGAINSTRDVAGIVFDGTPRNIEQYNLIKKIVYGRNENIDKLFLINISEAETIKRLSSRRTCKKCSKVYNEITKKSPNGDRCSCGGELVLREDDKPASIIERLRTYHSQTEKVVEKAKKEGLLFEIDGERPIEAIFKDIVKVIDNINTPPSV